LLSIKPPINRLGGDGQGAPMAFSTSASKERQQAPAVTSANGCFGLVRHQVAPGDLMMTSQWATRPGEYPDIAYPHLS
jgi:hypothetical protein